MACTNKMERRTMVIIQMKRNLVENYLILQLVTVFSAAEWKELALKPSQGLLNNNGLRYH